MQSRHRVLQLLVNSSMFYEKKLTLISTIILQAYKMLSRTMGRFKLLPYVCSARKSYMSEHTY